MSTPMDRNHDHGDEATDIHARGNVYGRKDFRAGRCQRHRIEVGELGDLAGKTLLHLQCHFGLGAPVARQSAATAESARVFVSVTAGCYSHAAA